MSTVEKIKADAARLNPDEQYELFRWWIESEGFRQRQLASLKQAIASGIDDLESGRYREYSDSNLLQLAEEVGQTGRKRLAKGPKKSTT